jgi:hypothetical protein
MFDHTTKSCIQLEVAMKGTCEKCGEAVGHCIVALKSTRTFERIVLCIDCYWNMRNLEFIDEEIKECREKRCVRCV